MPWKLALALSVVFLGSCGPSDGSSGAQSDAVADFTFTTFEGETFSAEEHRGTPVVLNFWESW